MNNYVKLFNKLNKSCLNARYFAFAESEVILTEINKCGVITLNRPKALNALNLNMTRRILPAMLKWNKNPKITHVIIEGTGEKAFCAGGDIVAVTKSAAAKDEHASDFFREEYQLNNLIGTFKKPYIALINGITMGGGVGLSVHGKYRIATEKTLFAMPETVIGFFPDVGGSYFLPRLPHPGLGTFLALSGHRLKGGDVFWAGVATHFVHSSKLDKLKERLVHLDLPENSSSNNDAIEKIINDIHLQDVPYSSPKLADHLPEIASMFGPNSALMTKNVAGGGVEALFQQLDVLAKDTFKVESAKWAENVLVLLKKSSPTSLKITLKQLTEGARLSFSEVFPMEFRLSNRFLENHDFAEGVRALLIDKDNLPQWQPNTLADIRPEDVDSYFAPFTSSSKEWSPAS